MSKKSRKRKLGIEDKAIFEWEKDRILPENLRDEMETMWELPQIYHFLQLTKEVLNINHLSMYEVERMLLMPKASKQLAHIMTCLLSSPSSTKAKLQRVPPMPYEFWTNILMYKLKNWFKVYHTKRADRIKVFDSFGVEPEFWQVFSDIPDVEGKDFLDFNFRQRVWLLKTVCDTAMHSRKTIQDEIAKQPLESQFETVLGIDRYGARYIYFPQFLHNDLRVYKHCLDNKVLLSVKAPVKEEIPNIEEDVKEELKLVARVASKKKKRRSRWSTGTLPNKKKDKRKSDLSLSDQFMIDSNSNSVHQHINENLNSSAKDTQSNIELESSIKENVKEIIQNLETEIDEDVKLCVKEETMASRNEVAKDCSFSTVDDLSKSSKTDDEKLEEISSMNASKTDEKLSSDTVKDVNVSKSDDEKLSESKKSDFSESSEFSDGKKYNNTQDENRNDNIYDSDNNELSDSALSSSGARRSARIKHISEIKLEVEDAENMLTVCESEELSSIDFRDRLCRVVSPELNVDLLKIDANDELKVENINELLDDISVSNFQLVADSLDSLKDLSELISLDETIPKCEIKQENFTRPACEEILLKRMNILYASLEKVESILKESTKKARNKLQREWNNFENGIIDEDQDTSPDQEGSSNCWVLGPQGCPLEGFPDRQPTLSNLALPSTSSRESDAEEISRASDASTAQATLSKIPEETASNCASPEGPEATKFERDEPKDCDTPKREGAEPSEKEEYSLQDPPEENSEGEDSDEEPEPTRVLRARGVSSYTEQLLTDEESEEEKLDGWTDIEAIYAPPSTHTSAPTVNTPTKTRDSCNDSETEDSDQDWILPSSRKRKNKRQSASRRLKSFQHKLQNIKVDQDGKFGEDQHHSGQPQTAQLSNSRILPNKLSNKSLNNSTVTRRISNVPTATNTSTSSSVPSHSVKVEPQDPGLHSVLDIKDEGPIYDSSTNQNANCIQSNYVVVTTGQSPGTNYYLMQQNPPVTAVVQQSQYIQPAAFVSQVVPSSQVQSMQHVPTYVQQNTSQNYVVQNPSNLITTGSPRQAFIAPGNSQFVYHQQQQLVQQPGRYVQYVAGPLQQNIQSQPRIINSTTLSPPRQIAYRMQGPGSMPNNRMPLPVRAQGSPHPNGAVIRSAPLAANVLRPGQRTNQPRAIAPRRQAAPRLPNPNSKLIQSNAPKNQKSTSLIVLSDSDDEIEMIVTKPTNVNSKSRRAGESSKVEPQTLTQKTKNVLPAELIQRISEGDVSISPIKPPQQSNTASSQNTQLVVVVNETGSHYALALPNGSKLILTPEQVAQIRASNGGKLVL